MGHGAASRFEYIRLLMEYEADDMPVVYFYEADLDGGRFCRRAMTFFSSGTTSLAT